MTPRFGALVLTVAACVCVPPALAASPQGRAGRTSTQTDTTSYTPLIEWIGPVSTDQSVKAVQVKLPTQLHQIVYVEGIGDVDSASTLTYATKADAIRVFDKKGGALLTQFPLTSHKPIGSIPASSPWTAYTSPRAAPFLDISTASYGPQYRAGRWSGMTFGTHALEVIDSLFPGGYFVASNDGVDNIYTVAREIPESDPRVQCRIAVRIAHPYPVTGEANTFEFRIFVSAQEKRTLTPWRSTLSDSSQRTVEFFVTALKNALEGHVP